ncbi:MAG TPA: D-alanine--D-alanine ligase family protein [Thermotogota bacterium]|nr:D-alanine--D-alanine ligase family protein [Thermotogota bacterium]
MKNKKTLGLIFGGNTVEHDVSIESARAIYNAYMSDKSHWVYEIIPIYIDKLGFWYDSASSERILKGLKVNKGVIRSETPAFDKGIDVGLPMIHGGFGEDGELQKILHHIGLPYAGADSDSSLLCYDKVLSRKKAELYHIPQPSFISFDLELINMKEIEETVSTKIKFPCFIKPARTGSSFGITKVSRQSEIPAGVQKAREIDTVILIEQAIDNCRELEIAALGREIPRLSMIGTINYKDEFYTNSAKYSDDSTELIIPAAVPQKIKEDVYDLAHQLFKIFRIRDFCRLDFFYNDKSGQLFWNEINTIPGFTCKSMFPQLWLAENISLNTVIEHIVKNSFK